jgi:hypothetical protein
MKYLILKGPHILDMSNMCGPNLFLIQLTHLLVGVKLLRLHNGKLLYDLQTRQNLNVIYIQMLLFHTRF